jgi:hypothetical protein
MDPAILAYMLSSVQVCAVQFHVLKLVQQVLSSCILFNMYCDVYFLSFFHTWEISVQCI